MGDAKEGEKERGREQQSDRDLNWRMGPETIYTINSSPAAISLGEEKKQGARPELGCRRPTKWVGHGTGQDALVEESTPKRILGGNGVNLPPQIPRNKTPAELVWTALCLHIAHQTSSFTYTRRLS